MNIQIVITAVWVAFLLATFVQRKRVSRRWRPGSASALGVILAESILLGLVIFTRGFATVAQLTLGIALLVSGGIINYHLGRYHGNSPISRGANRYFQLMHLDGQYPFGSLLGDWLQLAGLSLVWGTEVGALLALIGFPISVLGWRLKSGETGSMPVPESGSRFPSSSTVMRILFLPALIALLASILAREIVIFESANPLELVSLFLQIEATVGAVVVSVLFVLVELTASNYSFRFSTILQGNRALTYAKWSLSASILFKVLILANSGFSEAVVDSPLLRDALILIEILVLLAFVNLSRELFVLLSPEALAERVLHQLDDAWLARVRASWSVVGFNRTLYTETGDALILFERLLYSAIGKRDRRSVLIAMTQLSEKLGALLADTDAVLIDRYLSDLFTGTIALAADNGMDYELDAILQAVTDLTPISMAVLPGQYSDLRGVPPGASFSSAVLERSIPARLFDSSRTAIHALYERTQRHLEALAETHKRLAGQPAAQGGQSGEIVRLESQLTSGYLYGAFRRVAIRGISSGFPEVSSMATSRLTEFLGDVLRLLEDPEQRRSIVLTLLSSVDSVIDAAIEHRLVDAIHFSFPNDIGLLETNEEDNLPALISDYLASYLVKLTLAGMLTHSQIVNITMLGLGMVWSHPDAVVSLIRSYGEAGQNIDRRLKEQPNPELKFVRETLLERVGQLEGPASRQKGYKRKTRAAAARARKMIKGG